MSLEREFVPSGLAVARTPLLPFDEIEAWARDLSDLGPEADDAALVAALSADRALLRQRLAAQLARPEVREALFVASPGLVDNLSYWHRDPDGKRGRRAELGLVRYFLRMASRPTPFGLFSGCTPGRVGETTRLRLAGLAEYRRHSRLDNDYLFALCTHLTADPEIRSELLFRPNPSAYEVAGRLRYAESRVAGRLRTYHLVAVDAFDALGETLERAAAGARLGDLAQTLVAGDPDGEITQEDAAGFLDELVDNQILLPDLAVAVTGEESTPDLLRLLAGVASAGAARERVARADQVLATLDREGLGAAPERYREAADDLEPLGVEVDLSRLFQIDLIKPPREVVVGEPVIGEILRGVEILHRLVGQARHEPLLAEFRGAFRDRYGEGREVPLLAALDEESGIGFERSSLAGAEASPLLAGLAFGRRGEQSTVPWSPADAVLVKLLAGALAAGHMQVELTEPALAAMENRERPPLPDAFHALAMVAAPSAEAIGEGDFRVFLHNATGPSGARMLGRFCHVDGDIRAGVEAHLAAEEAHAPEALFAEIVHLPAGRMGNVLARPVLRGYEIPFLGRSGAPSERQLQVSDLRVTVIGDRIRLRSASLGREVVPRLTTAHNTTAESLGVYRFLAALQRALGMEWSWGPLEAAPFLPRVVSGRVVFSRARWRIEALEIARLVAASGAERHRRVRDFRQQHGMPRFVALVESDHELLLDFFNPLSVDAVLELAKGEDDVVLAELFPPPEELCFAGPEGRFVHELVIPFVRRPAAVREPAGVSPAPRLPLDPPRLVARAVVEPRAIQSTFPPGSEWLYAKLYTGTATADELLRDDLAPLAGEVLASGGAESWFFIRYGDPSWHLRIRFRGEPERLRDQVLPRVEELFRRLLESGKSWKLQLDTYEREVERYGGSEGIELAEEIFFHDTVAVVALLDSLSGDAGADLRWRLLLAGMDRLLDDFGLDLEARLALAERTRDGFARQYRYEGMRSRIADRLRPERGLLDRLLSDPTGAPEAYRDGLEALARRSVAIAGAVRELRARERSGRLEAPIPQVLASLIHMFVNRLSRSAGPEHELVLYDFLVQLYRSRVARSLGRADGRAPSVAISGER